MLSTLLLAGAAVCLAEGGASATIAVTLTVEPSCHVTVDSNASPSLLCGVNRASRPQPRIEVSPALVRPVSASAVPTATMSTDHLISINF